MVEKINNRKFVNVDKFKERISRLYGYHPPFSYHLDYQYPQIDYTMKQMVSNAIHESLRAYHQNLVTYLMSAIDESAENALCLLCTGSEDGSCSGSCKDKE